MSIDSGERVRLSEPRRVRLERDGRIGRALMLPTALLVGIASAAQALVSTPFSQSELSLPTTSTVATFTIDLATLPERPRLIVEAIPDSAHSDMTIELEITGCTVFNGGGNCQPSVISPATAGPQSVAYSIYRCDLARTYPGYVGETCDVNVRAASFGANPAPATVDLVIRGETVVPTSTDVREISAAIQTVSIPPTRDTTIYQPSTTSSNGRGAFLSVHHLSGSDRRNSLLAFDLAGYVPDGATITNAWIELVVTALSGDGPTINLFAIPRDPITPWLEGTSSSSDGFVAPLPATDFAATWTHRVFVSHVAVGPWTTPGGDQVVPALFSGDVHVVDTIQLASPALLDHVVALSAGSTAFDGLLINATSGGGMRIASRENPDPSLRPRLVVQYAPPPMTAISQTGTLNYFSEGQNFRWIYDLDNDNILLTPIAGRCTILGFNSTDFGYTYQFQGDPNFVGLDCCTWQIGSPTGVTGTGQALFFVNVSSTNPAYQPTDFDTDGIKDVCDSCPRVPNGPLLGSCSVGTKIGKLCRSNQDCGSGGACSHSQDDTDRIAPADACVPEPASSTSVLSGLLVIALAARLSRDFRPARRGRVSRP